MGVWVPKWKFKNRERLGLNIFKNGGLVVRKSKVWAKKSFVSSIIGSNIYVFFLEMRFCVRAFEYDGRFWPDLMLQTAKIRSKLSLSIIDEARR